VHENLDEKLAKLDEGFAAVQSALTVEDSNNQPTVDVSAGSSDANNATNDAQSADLRSQLAALQEKVATLEIPLSGQGGSDALVSAARQSVFSTIDPKFDALQTQLDETSSFKVMLAESFLPYLKSLALLKARLIRKMRRRRAYNLQQKVWRWKILRRLPKVAEPLAQPLRL